MRKIISSKIPYLGLAAVCALLIVIMQYGVITYALSLMRTDATIDIATTNAVDFTVHYMDNDFYVAGPVDHDIHYLMSFTEFIAVYNSFAAEFSDEIRMQYAYTATETLLIRYQQSGGDRISDPVVYRGSEVIDEKVGELDWATASFGQNPEDVPGGAYRVDPQPHILSYRDFIAAEAAQMAREDRRSERGINFSAELLLEFDYVLTFPDINRTERVSASLMIPLSDEVFSPEIGGEQNKELSLARFTLDRPGTPAIVLTIIATVGLVFGLCFGIWRYRQEKCKKRREFATIIRKYGDEIVFSTHSADMVNYAIIEVLEFGDLLKLAINAGKHILCHYDDKKAEFCVIVDGSAYTYGLRFTPFL